jgi:hypothetical protein
MIILHGFGARFGLPEIKPFVTIIGVRLRRASQQAQMELQCALARVFEQMIEHYVCWALAGARWIKPKDFANGKCCDTAP